MHATPAPPSDAYDPRLYEPLLILFGGKVLPIWLLLIVPSRSNSDGISHANADWIWNSAAAIHINQALTRSQPRVISKLLECRVRVELSTHVVEDECFSAWRRCCWSSGAGFGVKVISLHRYSVETLHQLVLCGVLHYSGWGTQGGTLQ